MTCANTVTLGAYLLGALDPRERFEFEAHLGGCDSCRTELVRLAPLPGMLNQISLDDFADGLPPTTLDDTHPTAPVPGLPLSAQLLRETASMPELFRPDRFRPEPGYPEEQVPPEFGGPVPSPRGPMPARETPPLRRPSGERSDPPGTPRPPARTECRRRYLLVAAAAALAVLLVVGGALGYQVVRPDQAPPEAAPPALGTTWRASTPDGRATVDARLVDHEWGTEIQLTIHGMPPGRECYMIVYDRGGYNEVAGWWGTDHAEDEEIPASTSIPRSKIGKLELLLDDHKVALTIPAQGR